MSADKATLCYIAVETVHSVGPRSVEHYGLYTNDEEARNNLRHRRWQPHDNFPNGWSGMNSQGERVEARIKTILIRRRGQLPTGGVKS